MGFDGVGRYYVALGAFFLILQGIMRYWFLPMMFKRQFIKYQFGKSEQGIDLYQDYAEILPMIVASWCHIAKCRILLSVNSLICWN